MVGGDGMLGLGKRSGGYGGGESWVVVLPFCSGALRCAGDAAM